MTVIVRQCSECGSVDAAWAQAPAQAAPYVQSVLTSRCNRPSGDCRGTMRVVGVHA